MLDKKVLQKLEEVTNASYEDSDINDIILDVVGFYEAEIEYLKDRLVEVESKYYDLASMDASYKHLF